MRIALFFATTFWLLLSGCKTSTDPAAASADIVRTNFPDTLTTETIYLGDTQLPQGTRFFLQDLPTGQRLEISLPAGTEVDLRKPDGTVERTSEICYACECFQDDASCEVALYNVQGGQLGFLQGDCGAEVIGWYCESNAKN